MKDTSYVIITDSGCDLPAAMAEELELTVLPLSVLIDGREYFNYLDERDITFKDFYAQIRAGKMPTTSAVNSESFRTAMEQALKEGKDILYLGFSSGLSYTYGAGVTAAEELREAYPERKIYTVDTLCASMGQGFMLYHCARMRLEGAPIEEVRDFAEEKKLNVIHLVMADDLNHLKRGGRVSATSAAIGTMLNIKPMIRMDDEGKLSVTGKVRGRKAAIKSLISDMAERGMELKGGTAMISHADCLEDAETLAAQIKEKLELKDVIISYIGPVIGAHTGANTMALFFWGKER